MNERFVLAQISDFHISQGPGGPAAEAGLRRTFEALRRHKVDAIVATGDLANDEKAEEYAALAPLLRDAPAPLYLAPGNHDDPALMRAAFPEHYYLPPEGPLSYVIERFPVRLVVIDQTVHGAVHGAFTPEHASWLEAVLARAPREPTIVALHHPPFATHDILFDTIALKQSERFAEVIARHPQVLRIICGHHHRLAVGQVAHAPAIVAPSTAWTYGLALEAGEPVAPKTAEPCGYLLHVWTRAGGLASHFMALA